MERPTATTLVIAITFVGIFMHAPAAKAADPLLERYRNPWRFQRYDPEQVQTMTVRPTGAVHSYRERFVDTIDTVDWTKSRQRMSYDRRSTFEERLSPFNEQAIERHRKYLIRDLWHNGHKTEHLRQPLEETLLINLRNEPINEGGRRYLPSTSMAIERVVLPKQPVAVGDTWVDVIPARKNFPAPLRIQYKLAGYQRIRGRRCALIYIEELMQNAFPDDKLSVDMQMSGRLHFDVDAGLIVLLVQNWRYTIWAIKRHRAGRPRFESRSIERTLRLIR